ncbi:Myb-like DNA-binding domain containing protein [Trichomonas vaginalis G3]|uniref:Myb-like DNA-binding domain containing protein n=1 Tax=Trichomonas vaginalis (strain ATCC PRA-98 / G3) TaxID=412133 RepID=A2EJB9_TRIV3|nr:RNA polymerase II transcription regulator recruiting protein [Trichomonas vaginalis G3]EAY07271.1 Myb-like DNA-binding domain containing protein [Trichomonas vaginalis G3]KAI5511957.1 RNA polymerase II transcription regulator recruiting protein [Trichomonas vaginalis G3]|eukprot:XP_001319494.1 Myb-like DNA-binding domain containing protein [Trichomonas vaginalis G3]
MDRKLPNGTTPVRKQGEMRSKFTKEEDAKLLQLVNDSGKTPNWRSISIAMETRTPRQCRERYQNYLRPNIEHTLWTAEEDQLLLQQYEIHGNKWNLIAKTMKGRTGNTIRNRFLSLYRRQHRYDKEEPVVLKKDDEMPIPATEQIVDLPSHVGFTPIIVEVHTPKVRLYVLPPVNQEAQHATSV